MLVNAIILAFSCSIDAFGLGITYGLKDTKMPLISKVILFSLALLTGVVSVYIGSYLKFVLPDFIAKILSCSLLVILGISIFIGAIRSIHKMDLAYDKNNDNLIEPKEALFLALAVSIDLACVGITGGIMGITSFIFPLLMATFHLLFVCFGIFIGSKINKLINIPNYVWSIISSFLIIIIGISKFFI